MQKIQIERTTAPKAKPADESKLGFGKIFTDHMYVMEYNPEQGWHDPKIMPYQPIVLDPSAMVFHYGQEMFEGMKAYKCADGRIRLFRPNKNIERANNSNRRLCIPEIPADDFLNARFAHASMGDTLFHKKCRAVVGAAFEILFEGKHSMGRKVRLAVFAAFAKQHDLSLFKADIGQI